MSQTSALSPEVVVTNDVSNNTVNELDNQQPERPSRPTLNNLNIHNDTATIKQKRKVRSTRRRLNALMNNASLHFSDTDSEGELSIPRANTPCSIPKLTPDINFLQPVISVTVDGSDNYEGSRRASFIDNLTDVDEIYASDPEIDGIRKNSVRENIEVVDNGPVHGETDFEDISNDEGEVLAPIYIEARSDILCDFTGGSITTKEGDGPFSVEIRNQMSIDNPKDNPTVSDTPEILIVPTTDSEEMEASDEDDDIDGAACLPTYKDLDVMTGSQIEMKNLNKTDQFLIVKEADDGVSDGLTDVEDLE